MTDKTNEGQTFEQFLKLVGVIVFVLWIILSLIVVAFLLDKKPGMKGISGTDLMDYGKISVLMLGFFIATRFIKSKN